MGIHFSKITKAVVAILPLRLFTLAAMVFFASIIHLHGQDLPKKIRGYKVHNEVIVVSEDKPAAGGPFAAVGEPSIADVSLTGVTVTVAGELQAAGYDGTVDMLMFHDFRVNGTPVEVEDLNQRFTLRKTGTTTLPAPARIFLPTSSVLKAAWKEATESKEMWLITGRIFAFGKFRKFGFNFKRAVPIDVRLVMKNPLSGK